MHVYNKLCISPIHVYHFCLVGSGSKSCHNYFHSHAGFDHGQSSQFSTDNLKDFCFCNFPKGAGVQHHNHCTHLHINGLLSNFSWLQFLFPIWYILAQLYIVINLCQPVSNVAVQSMVVDSKWASACCVMEQAAKGRMIQYLCAQMCASIGTAPEQCIYLSSMFIVLLISQHYIPHSVTHVFCVYPFASVFMAPYFCSMLTFHAYT